jgi:hypothetical protein
LNRAGEPGGTAKLGVATDGRQRGLARGGDVAHVPGEIGDAKIRKATVLTSA